MLPRPGSQPLVCSYRWAKVSGNGFKAVSQLSDQFVSSRHESAEQLSSSVTLQCLFTLETCHKNAWDNNLCLENLQKLYTLITDERVLSFDDVQSAISPRQSGAVNRENLILLSGLEVLVKLLLSHPVHFPASGQSELQKRKELDAYDKVRFLVIQILHTICSSHTSTEAVKRLASNENLFKNLLQFLTNKILSFGAMILLEDLIVLRDEPIDLRFMDIDKLMSAITIDNFSNLCRVLSFAIVDIKDEPVELLKAIDAREKVTTKAATVCEQNIAFLSEMPSLVSLLIDIITRKFEQSNKLFMEYLGVAIDVLEENSSPANSLIASIRMALMGMPENLGITNQGSDTAALLAHMNRMDLNRDLLMRVEGIILMVGLLYGGSRTLILDVLVEKKIIPKINNYFEFFFKTDSEGNLREVNESTHQNLRIQVLRLVHSFCDQQTNNCIMLTSSELNEIQQYHDEYFGGEGTQHINGIPEYMCEGSKGGLLTKLVSLLTKTPADSIYRFWLSRAIESFLRGKTLYPFQTYLARLGVIEDTATTITSLSNTNLPSRSHELDERSTSGSNYEDILQCSFDLLGHVVKFNMPAIQKLSDHLESSHTFGDFLVVIFKNVIDSNMFVRCIILSLDKFARRHRAAAAAAEKGAASAAAIHGNKILWHFDNTSIRLSYVCKIMDCINVDNLTQDNVSCLNTAIVILLFALDNGQLPLYLTALQRLEQEKSYPGHYFRNLYNLLVFWRLHYGPSGKDSTCLQEGSGIVFHRWAYCISVLLEPNTFAPTSLFHYQSDLFTHAHNDHWCD